MTQPSTLLHCFLRSPAQISPVQVRSPDCFRFMSSPACAHLPSSFLPSLLSSDFSAFLRFAGHRYITTKLILSSSNARQTGQDKTGCKRKGSAGEITLPRRRKQEKKMSSWPSRTSLRLFGLWILIQSGKSGLARGEGRSGIGPR